MNERHKRNLKVNLSYDILFEHDNVLRYYDGNNNLLLWNNTQQESLSTEKSIAMMKGCHTDKCRQRINMGIQYNLTCIMVDHSYVNGKTLSITTESTLFLFPEQTTSNLSEFKGL